MSARRSFRCIALTLGLASALIAPLAGADERRGPPGHERGFERGPERGFDRGHERGPEIYRAPHWVYDRRHHLDHYYPAVGYVVPGLPTGYVTVGFGARRYYFSAGVWYEFAPGGYLVVRPPLGVVVPVLPPAYATVWVGRVPYYYANEVYYVGAPGGYRVAAPPQAYVERPPEPQPGMPAPPPPQPVAPPQAAQSGTDWYWCEASRAYYPYVQSCAGGWRAVPARPQGVR